MKYLADPVAMSIACFRFAGYTMAAQMQIWNRTMQAGLTLAAGSRAHTGAAPGPAQTRTAAPARTKKAPAPRKPARARARTEDIPAQVAAVPLAPATPALRAASVVRLETQGGAKAAPVRRRQPSAPPAMPGSAASSAGGKA